MRYALIKLVVLSFVGCGPNLLGQSTRVSSFEQVPTQIDSDREVLRPEPRQKAKLPFEVCRKINEFLAPDMWPGLLHRLPEGGPVT